MKHASQELDVAFLPDLPRRFRNQRPLPADLRAMGERTLRYLAGIVKRNKGRVIIINGMSDHVHLLIILEPCDLPAFMRELKASSSRWAKQHQPKFAWQRRYGAFTVSESAIEKVRDYIRDQKKHHAKRTFEQEYVGILRNHNVEFEERYLWD